MWSATGTTMVISRGRGSGLARERGRQSCRLSNSCEAGRREMNVDARAQNRKAAFGRARLRPSRGRPSVARIGVVPSPGLRPSSPHGARRRSAPDSAWEGEAPSEPFRRAIPR